MLSQKKRLEYFRKKNKTNFYQKINIYMYKIFMYFMFDMYLLSLKIRIYPLLDGWIDKLMDKYYLCKMFTINVSIGFYYVYQMFTQIIFIHPSLWMYNTYVCVYLNCYINLYWLYDLYNKTPYGKILLVIGYSLRGTEEILKFAIITYHKQSFL